MMAPNREIVLLGANMAGIPMAHYLLKHTIPQLNAEDTVHRYHLTIMSPNSEYYWKLGSPAVISGSMSITTDTLSHSVREILSQYDSSSYTQILGRAVNIDATTRTVSFAVADTDKRTSAATTSAITYYSLIIATGTSSSSPLFSPNPSTQALHNAQLLLRARLPHVKTVLVAGGGPVGVETASALAASHPHLDVALYTGGKRLLERSVPEKVSIEADRLLKDLGVTVVYGVRVLSAEQLNIVGEDQGVEEAGQILGDGRSARVNLDDGSSKTIDVYISGLTSGRNVSFMPEAWVGNHGVKADKDSLRVTAPTAERVYVLGDANEHSDGQFLWASDGVRPLADSLFGDVMKGLGKTNRAGKARKFNSIEGILVLPIGGSGTGIMKCVKAPGWLVHWFKSNYLVSMMPDWVSGKALEKA